MPDQPLNLIIITSDEMRGDCPSFMGNPDCKTPCLDRFAQQAVVFDQHFTVHGKCVPSRISMVTGRYCHTDGFRTIWQHMDPNDPNLLKTLKAQGYETAVIGHNHVWEDFWGENKKSGGCVDYHSYTEAYMAPLLEREWPVAEPGADSAELVEMGDGVTRYTGRREGPLTGFRDDNRAEQAIHYLRDVRDQTRPFYLHVNMGAPHPSYMVEEPYFSMYDRHGIKSWPHALPENAPLPAEKMREIRTGHEVPERELLEIQAVYYGMVTKVDLLIGRVLNAIEADGYLENSIVLFTVDHGDFAGQYGLYEKWDTCMADCILHVPMILHAPGLPKGKRVTSLTEHVDIAPTVLDLLGLEPDWGLHGTSLLKSLNGTVHKDAVFADGGHEEEMRERFSFPESRDGKPLNGKQVTYRDHPDTMARTKMVRTREWKLVVREAGGNELYHLTEDPDELKNLWGRHESDAELAKVVLGLQERLLQWCLRTDTDRPYQEKVGA